MTGTTSRRRCGAPKFDFHTGWQARDPRDPRAQVPGPQPIGDPPPRVTGLHVFASKWHENRAAKLAADQPVPDISVEEAWANLPPETRERFEQVARKGGK